jgi:biopolymer transport protein ExbB
MSLDQLIELSVKGGFTIFVLLFCSILSLKVIIEKAIQFRGLNDKILNDLQSKIHNLIKEKRFEEAIKLCDSISWNWLKLKIKSPLSKVYKYIIEKKELDKEELTELTFNKLDKEVTILEKGLGILATLGSISPFIGLFGTVVGIIKSFEALTVSDTQNYTKVMAGIAEALIATAAGLFVAIPAVMFYNYFMKKIKLNMPNFDETIVETIRLVKKS